VRDLLHVGAGVWAFGLRLWHRPTAPIAITVAALVSLALLPRAASRVRVLARFRDAVSSQDERFGGLVLYAASFCAFTALAVLDEAPTTAASGAAAAALAALALGDGVGGLVGRRFGRVRYRVPWAKEKSLEGSAAVAAFVALALVAVGAWYDRPFGLVSILVASLAAAVAEAIAPRASDNVLLPAVVWGVLRVLRVLG
jgi:dolichol kinase